MKRANLFVDSMFFYGLTLAFTKVLGIVMLVLYSRSINPESFGLYDITFTFFNLMGVLGMLGMSAAMFRTCYDDNSDAWRRKTVLTALYITAFATLILVIVLFLVKDFLGPKIWKNSTYDKYVYAGLIFMFVNNISVLVTTTLYRIQNARKNIIVNMILVAILNFIAGYYFFIFQKKDAIYLLYISTLIHFIELVYGLIVNRILLFKNPVIIDFKLAKELLKIGLPLAPEGLLFWIITANSRLLINAHFGSEALGVYAMSNKLAAIVNVIQIIFSQSWSYFAYSVMKDKDASKVYGKIFNILTIVCFVVMFTMAGFSDYFFRFFIGEKFYEGYKISALMAIGPVFTILGYVSSVGVQITKKSYYRTIIMIVVGFVNVTGCYLLIPMYGLMGAAAVTFISYTLSLVLNMVIGYRLFPVMIKYSKVTLALILFLIIVALKAYVKWNLIYDVFLVSGSCLVLLAINVKEIIYMYNYISLRIQNYSNKKHVKNIQSF